MNSPVYSSGYKELIYIQVINSIVKDANTITRTEADAMINLKKLDINSISQCLIFIEGIY